MSTRESAVFTVRNTRTDEVLVHADLHAVSVPYDEDGHHNKEVVPVNAHTDAMNATLALLVAAQRESYSFFGRLMQSGGGAGGADDEASHNDEHDDADSTKLQSSEWSVDITRDDGEGTQAKRSRVE